MGYYTIFFIFIYVIVVLIVSNIYQSTDKKKIYTRYKNNKVIYDTNLKIENDPQIFEIVVKEFETKSTIFKVLSVIMAFVSFILCVDSAFFGIVVYLTALVFLYFYFFNNIIKIYYSSLQIISVDDRLVNYNLEVKNNTVYVLKSGYHMIETVIKGSGQDIRWEIGPKNILIDGNRNASVCFYRQNMIDFLNPGDFNNKEGIYYFIGGYWNNPNRVLYLYDAVTGSYIEKKEQIESDYEHYRFDDNGGFYFRKDATNRVELTRKDYFCFSDIATKVNGLYLLGRSDKVLDRIYEEDGNLGVYEYGANTKRIYAKNKLFILNPQKNYIAIYYDRIIGNASVEIPFDDFFGGVVLMQINLKTIEMDYILNEKDVLSVAKGEISVEDYIKNNITGKIVNLIRTKEMKEACNRMAIELSNCFVALDAILREKNIVLYRTMLNKIKMNVRECESQFATYIRELMINSKIIEGVFRFELDQKLLEVNFGKLENLLEPYEETIKILPPIPDANQISMVLQALSSIPVGMESELLNRASNLISGNSNYVNIQNSIQSRLQNEINMEEKGIGDIKSFLNKHTIRDNAKGGICINSDALINAYNNSGDNKEMSLNGFMKWLDSNSRFKID